MCWDFIEEKGCAGPLSTYFSLFFKIHLENFSYGKRARND
jgi:hypothetical protein